MDALRRLYVRTSVAFFTACLTAAILPALLVVPLRWVDPPTTAVLLARSLERWRADSSPVIPARTQVPLGRISPHLRRAVVAAEDDRFYEHDGFDLREIADALEAYESGRRLRGASTITQQTAKNLFLWEGRSWVRKVLEAYLTVLLEAFLPKDRILEIYLNNAEWGDGVIGAEEAARSRFGKGAADITRREAVILAAILPSPRRWSPRSPRVVARAEELAGRLWPSADSPPPP